MNAPRFFILGFVAVSTVSASAFAEPGYGGYGQSGYGNNGYGQYGQQQQGAGSYPFTGGSYGMSGGGGGGGGAQYKQNSDANELKESGPEYTKQISENTSKALESGAEESTKRIEQISKSQPDEVPVSEAVVKSAEELVGSLSGDGIAAIAEKYAKDAAELSKTITGAIEIETKAKVAAIKASGKEPIPEPTVGGMLTQLQQDNSIGAAARQASGGGGLSNAVAATSGTGKTVQLSQVPARQPASHAMTSDSQPKAQGSNVTGFDRGMLHNPPSGFEN
jgi:hypothetical protein